MTCASYRYDMIFPNTQYFYEFFFYFCTLGMVSIQTLPFRCLPNGRGLFFSSDHVYQHNCTFPFIRLFSFLVTMMTILILLIMKSFLYSRWYRLNWDWPLSDGCKESLFNVKLSNELPRFSFRVNSELKRIYPKSCSKSAFLQKPKQISVPALAKIFSQTQ